MAGPKTNCAYGDTIMSFSYNSKICYQAKQSLPFEITCQHKESANLG